METNKNEKNEMVLSYIEKYYEDLVGKGNYFEIPYTKLPSITLKGDLKDETKVHEFMGLTVNKDNIPNAVFHDIHGEKFSFDIRELTDSEACSLSKAVKDTLSIVLGLKCKDFIHDRITKPWQRYFTPDQVKVLDRYHQVVAQDKPAGEVFKELLQEVAQNPDVARKPEKWVADTAKELDTIAEGITRTETRGLHK